MDRAELQKLANERIAEARALLAVKRWAGAYYLAGYAVECGLKSCVITYLMRTDRFPERKYSEQCWTHNLAQLLGVAGLTADFEAACRADPNLQANWDIVDEWSESSRYVCMP